MNITPSQIKLMLNAGAYDLTGKGVRIAVLDTGASPNHPMLRNKIKEAYSVINEDVYDKVGHSTAVMSILAGNKTKTPYGVFEGIAPDAELISIKVFNRANGSGSFGDFINGAKLAVKKGADLIVYAGGGAPSNGNAPQDKYVNKLAEQYRVMTIAAAGNEGAEQGINSPASAFNSICVGGVNSNGILSGFSNSGPVLNYIKPDIVGYAGDDYEKILMAVNGWLDIDKNNYEALHGSSFAVPQIAGLMALSLEHARRKLNRDEWEFIFSDGYQGFPKNNDYGWGLPDFRKWMDAEVKLL